MSVVRPELGPTLLELLGPRVRAWPRPVRLALIGAILAGMALLFWLALRPDPTRRPLVVRGPVPFNLLYSAEGLVRVRPQGGEVLRLGTRAGADPQSFAVTPVRLPAYRGDITAYLTLASARTIQEMRARLPGFVWRGDGRTSINKQPGYQILYQARIAGRTVYGKRLMLAPFPEGPREGLDITLQSARSDTVPNVGAVGANGLLKTPLRSLRFGEDRP